MRPARRIRRTRHGDFEVRLPAEERQVLVTLVGALQAALDGDVRAEPALRRLFPPAYADSADEEAESQYQAMVHDELLAWMTALNELRLVLGTRLDVSEDDEPVLDPEDPAAPLHEIYHYLGVLLEAVIDALED